MADLFTWTTAQFGLAVGLLIIAVVIVSKALSMKDRALIERYEREIARLEIQSNFYRDRWIEAVDTAEVGEQAAKRLARGRRRTGES